MTDAKSNKVESSFNTVIKELNKNFFDQTNIPPLTDQEKIVLKAAYDNLSGMTKERGQLIDDEYTPFGKLEKSDIGQRFALDYNAFQIIRRVDPKDAKLDEPWARFGLEIEKVDGKEVIRPFWRENMFKFQNKEVDPNTDLPESALHINRLNKNGDRVIALLGGARIKIHQGMLLIEFVQALIDHLDNIAVMTGGYRGEEGNSYGITRAGFDVPRSRGLQTLVVMCEAGLGHAHQTAESRSIYGKNWGDDTPGLSAISDLGIFFRNVPPEKNFGAWTEVEIANFLHLKKHAVILDPTLSEKDFPDGIKEEIFFEHTIKIFRDPIALAKYAATLLPTSADVKKRPLYQPNKEEYVQAIYNRQIDGDMLVEDWLAVRINYKLEDEDRVIPDEMKARWEKNDRTPFLKHGEVFTFSNKPGAMEEGRDLLLSGYWKDIMLLQMLGKLKKDDTRDNLISGYAEYRMAMEKEFETNPGRGHQYKRRLIDDVWFIYLAEHYPGFLNWLKDLEPNEYDKKLQASG